MFSMATTVHRANEALKQLGFAFLSYLGQGARIVCQLFYNCGQWRTQKIFMGEVSKSPNFSLH